MTKSYKRDIHIQVLLKMLENVDSTRGIMLISIIHLKVLYIKIKDGFDLCSFYLAQFGEKVKLLTDSSKSNLSSVVDLNILKYFRNIIDHDYESVNKLVLQGYIQSLVSNDFRNALISRIKYCKLNKR